MKAQHEAEIMAADERAARRWADQAERMRQLHEQEKIDVAERERNRAKDRVERQLQEIEKETTLTRERYFYKFGLQTASIIPCSG